MIGKDNYQRRLRLSIKESLTEFGMIDDTANFGDNVGVVLTGGAA